MGDLYDPKQRELRRRQDANWRAMPIVLGVVFLFALGFLIISDSTNPPVRSTSVETQGSQSQ